MAKRKYPSELNTRTVRINIGDWQLLLEISRRAGINVAEAFHNLLAKRIKPEPAYRIIPSQAYRVTPSQAYRALGTTVIATNGSKPVALGIKPKGVSYE